MKTKIKNLIKEIIECIKDFFIAISLALYIITIPVLVCSMFFFLRDPFPERTEKRATVAAEKFAEDMKLPNYTVKCIGKDCTIAWDTSAGRVLEQFNCWNGHCVKY
jgi:hypothetical protein